jgi:Zn-dependent protease
MNFDIEFFFIYGLGTIFVIFLLRYLLVAQNILGIVFKQPVSRLIDRKKCPQYLQDLYAEKEGQLVELGFQYSHSHMTEDMVQRKHCEKYYFIYYNQQKNTYASLVAAPQADSLIPIWITFQTYFSNGTKCSTLDGVRHDIIDDIPDTVLQDNYTGNLQEQWTLHLSYLEKNPQLEIKTFADSEAGFQEKLAYEDQSYRKYLRHLQQKGYLYKAEGEDFLVKTFASVRIAHTLLTSMQMLAKLKQKLQKTGKKIELPLELDVQNYQNALATLNSKSKNITGKFIFLILTLVLFVAVFSLIFTFEMAIILMAVIFIHECGHLLAMYLFGYKDLRMLFIPLFGAVAIGSDTGVTASKKVITYFAGPLPGIILAAILAFSSPNLLTNYTMLSITLMLVVINYFNLIPIMPLDGGQILNTILFSRTLWLQTFFLAFSLISMLALGIYFSEPILMVIGLVLIFTFKAHFSQRKFLQQLKERFGDHGEYSQEELIGETISILKSHPNGKASPFQRKFKIIQQIEASFNTTKASITTVFVSLVVYITIFLLPIVYIVLPILAGKPLPFLCTQYPEPCARVRAFSPPQQLDIQSAASRFIRINASEIKPNCGTNTVFRYCFQVNDINQSGAPTVPAPAADFLSRIWAHFGEPDIIENGFAYTIQDQQTGVIITAHCVSLVPLFLSDNMKEEGFIATLYLFEQFLQQTPPADCELDITLDYSKYNREMVETDGDIEAVPITHYKIGSKEGKPFQQVAGPAKHGLVVSYITAPSQVIVL